jgi:hypothetical protein
MPYVTSWEQIGIEKGIEKGKQEGKQEGLLQAIELGLKLRFAAEGEALLPVVRQRRDVELLQRITDALKTGASLEDIQKLLAGS